MGHNLEYPGTDEGPDWESLYRARGDEVVAHRPFFTGDVFQNTRVQSIEAQRTRTILLVQHPCALRTNGIDLTKRLLVAEVKQFDALPKEGWLGHLDRMPLPDLFPSTDGRKRNQSAFFDAPYLVADRALEPANRIACLSPVGVNLLLQRWVVHNSRVVVPTFDYQGMTAGPYEEADLIEEWCSERIPTGVDVDHATKEAMNWLREDLGEGMPTRQGRLADPQRVSSVRKEMRTRLKGMGNGAN